MRERVGEVGDAVGEGDGVYEFSAGAVSGGDARHGSGSKRSEALSHLKIVGVPGLKILSCTNHIDTFICVSASSLSTETYDDFDTRILEVGMLN